MKNSDMPAMPHPEEGYYTNPKQGTGFNLFTGLTKREHFAAMAMQGILSAHREGNIWPSATGLCPFQQIAESAIKHTDALLAELDKPVPANTEGLVAKVINRGD